MKLILRIFFLIVSSSFFVFPAVAGETFDFSTLRSIPILDQGRAKPLDTFARESVQTITGKTYFQGKDPLETLLYWIASPEKAIGEPLLLARYEPLNRRIGLEAANGRISPAALLDSKEFKNFLKSAMLKQQEGESLNPTEKEAADLFGRLSLFQQILTGSALALFPPSPTSLSGLGTSEGEGAWAGADRVSDSPSGALFKKVVTDFQNNDSKAFAADSQTLKETLRNMGGKISNYPSERMINLETTFNKVRPFQKAWIVFLCTFVLALLSFGFKTRSFYRAAVGVGILGVLISVYGFIVRSLISGRPPVSNMYESVIWVSFGAMIFALIFEAIYRSRYFLLSGAAGATIGLVLADNLPNVLSGNINPLVPVLRSNFWLTIHVLTITLSYAAFLLATGIAQAAIGYYAFKPKALETIKSLNLFLYRALQVGVVLLAAGTILGGVWANYSWGRFWGWDPKEVWALIALLGYLAILHGRFAGWLRDFGMAVWSVLAFLLVLMAWYGVNFVLGVGLHSYGFSSGGFTGVMIFVAVQLAWVLFATIRYKKFPSPLQGEG